MGFQYWEILVSAAGVIVALIFDGWAALTEAKTRKVANLINLTTNHREIWFTFLNDRELLRVRDPQATIETAPITLKEEIFTVAVVLHLASSFAAEKNHLTIKEEGLRLDVSNFFSQPIPEAIWEKVKQYYNDDFVAYVESCRQIKRDA